MVSRKNTCLMSWCSSSGSVDKSLLVAVMPSTTMTLMLILISIILQQGKLLTRLRHIASAAGSIKKLATSWVQATSGRYNETRGCELKNLESKSCNLFEKSMWSELQPFSLCPARLLTKAADVCVRIYALYTPSLKLPFSHLKMHGRKTIVSFWGPAYFQGRTVSFRESRSLLHICLLYIICTYIYTYIYIHIVF